MLNYEVPTQMWISRTTNQVTIMCGPSCRTLMWTSQGGAGLLIKWVPPRLSHACREGNNNTWEDNKIHDGEAFVGEVLLQGREVGEWRGYVGHGLCRTWHGPISPTCQYFPLRFLELHTCQSQSCKKKKKQKKRNETFNLLGPIKYQVSIPTDHDTERAIRTVHTHHEHQIVTDGSIRRLRLVGI